MKDNASLVTEFIDDVVDVPTHENGHRSLLVMEISRCCSTQ